MDQDTGIAMLGNRSEMETIRQKVTGPWEIINDTEFKKYIKSLLRCIRSPEDREDIEQEIYLELLNLNITDFDEMVDIAYMVFNRMKWRIRKHNVMEQAYGGMVLG